MVRKDDFFLRKWVEYYSASLGRENLYIYFDGTDQTVPGFCEGCNVVVKERLLGKTGGGKKGRLAVARGDKARITFLNSEAKKLFERYDAVIGTDVDEFLIVDPALEMTLPQFLAKTHREHPGWSSVSGLGFDIVQHTALEKEIDPAIPFLSQRGHCISSSRYTKTNVLFRPVEWGSGFHRVEGHNFHIAKGLYMFHFGLVDRMHILRRIAAANLVAEGWGKHLDKRERTYIRVASEPAPRPWSESLVESYRRTQQRLRKFFAWNKPTNLCNGNVLKLDARFSGLL